MIDSEQTARSVDKGVSLNAPVTRRQVNTMINLLGLLLLAFLFWASNSKAFSDWEWWVILVMLIFVHRTERLRD